MVTTRERLALGNCRKRSRDAGFVIDGGGNPHGGNLISLAVGSASARSSPPHGFMARKDPSNHLALQLVELLHLLAGGAVHDSG